MEWLARDSAHPQHCAALPRLLSQSRDYNPVVISAARICVRVGPAGVYTESNFRAGTRAERRILYLTRALCASGVKEEVIHFNIAVPLDSGRRGRRPRTRNVRPTKH